MGTHLLRFLINRVVYDHRVYRTSMVDGTRVRSAKRNGAAPSELPIPEAIDPTGLLDALVRRIERASNNVGNNNHATHPPRQTRDKLLERFRALRPKKFDGIKEPCKAEQWLQEMNSIFRAIDCSEVEKRLLATFQLTYTVANRWEVEEATLAAKTIKRMMTRFK